MNQIHILCKFLVIFCFVYPVPFFHTSFIPPQFLFGSFVGERINKCSSVHENEYTQAEKIYSQFVKMYVFSQLKDEVLKISSFSFYKYFFFGKNHFVWTWFEHQTPAIWSALRIGEFVSWMAADGLQKRELSRIRIEEDKHFEWTVYGINIWIWRILNFECSCCVFRDFFRTPFLYILYTQINVRSIQNCILSNVTFCVLLTLRKEFLIFFPLCWVNRECFWLLLAFIGTQIFMQGDLFRLSSEFPASACSTKLFKKLPKLSQESERTKSKWITFSICSYRPIAE